MSRVVTTTSKFEEAGVDHDEDEVYVLSGRAQYQFSIDTP